MTTHDNYAWLKRGAAAWLKNRPTQIPNLTLITTNQTSMEERNQTMSTPEAKQPEEICRMWNGKPLSEHGAFSDIDEAQRMLSMGSNALKGIGAMLLPSTESEDKETAAKRLELSEIFSFFGEVMADNSQHISDAVFRIEQAANGRVS